MNCAYCRSEEYEIVSDSLRDSKLIKVIQCKSCEILSLSPLPSPSEMETFIDSDGQTKNAGMSQEMETLRRCAETDTERRVRQVSRLITPDKSLLDIGSGYGFFLSEMFNRKYNITGLEISRDRREQIKSHTRAPVISENILTGMFQTQYDCITLFHVLEHITELPVFLNKLKTLLKPGGKIVIEVPNADDLLLKSCPSYKNFYWQTAHIYYFTAKTLSAVLSKCGYAILSTEFVQRYSLSNFMNWMTKEKPQINIPINQPLSNYGWLEAFYENYLTGSHKSDTISLVVQPQNLL